MDKPIKIGIAGLGRTGWRNHALRLHTLPDKFTVAAVSDPDESRRQQAVGQFSCRHYATFEELIGDPELDVVVVATPNQLHCAQTVAALEAGKDVVCEKPMATSLADADRMIATAGKTGRLLTVFHNNHFAHDFAKVSEVIASGKLGRIVQIKMRWNGFGRRWDWQTLKKFGGGSLNNTGPHPLEQALSLFGPGEPEIFCHMENVLSLGDAEDHVKVILKGEGAPLIDLEISSLASYATPKWTVWGDCGGLSGSATELHWKYFDPADLPERTVSEIPTPDRSYNREDVPWKPEESWKLPEQEPTPPQVAFYEALYATLRGGSDLAITPGHARRVMATMQKCHDLAGI